MKFVPLEIEGVRGIVGQAQSDSRGHLIRVWDTSTILKDFGLKQASVVTNPLEGTLRGLHFQTSPFSENKVVQCISGKVFDVIVDIRHQSKTYGQHLGLILGPSEPYFGLIVPAGCAHGYLTLENNSTLVYFMDKVHSREHAKGLKWNDTKLGISWPRIPKLVSAQDMTWADFLQSNPES